VAGGEPSKAAEAEAQARADIAAAAIAPREYVVIACTASFKKDGVLQQTGGCSARQLTDMFTQQIAVTAKPPIPDGSLKQLKGACSAAALIIMSQPGAVGVIRNVVRTDGKVWVLIDDRKLVQCLCYALSTAADSDDSSSEEDDSSSEEDDSSSEEDEAGPDPLMNNLVARKSTVLPPALPCASPRLHLRHLFLPAASTLHDSLTQCSTA
jgi:hypothetical protein